jgi:hypothetical protein
VAGSVPSPNAAQTASFAGSQAEANSLATEVKAGYGAAAGASVGAGFKGPLGVQFAALPNGISASLSCSLLGSGGTGTITYDIPNTTLGAGYTVTYSYNACSYSGNTFNGGFSIVYDRYVSATDFSYTATYTNFTVSGNGFTNQAINGKTNCSFSGGTANCYYNDGARGWSSTFVYSGGIANGAYGVNYGNGTAQVSYVNFSATGGTATVTGANGSKAVITRTSATGFTVVITPSNGAAPLTYSVTV